MNDPKNHDTDDTDDLTSPRQPRKPYEPPRVEKRRSLVRATLLSGGSGSTSVGVISMTN